MQPPLKRQVADNKNDDRGNGTASQVSVANLRSPLRVINHFDLIQHKLDVGRRWRLIPAGALKTAANADVLQKLGRGPLDVDGAVSEISRRSGINEALSILRRDLLSCYQTGLLEFHPTDVCDLDCIDCHYRRKDNATMPLDRVAEILIRLAPRAITVTGGGEPNVYRSNEKGFGDLVQVIREALPSVKLGLINNNSHIPPGEWTDQFIWQRSSIDAATPETYAALKRRTLYETVTENVKRFLRETEIPHVGVGYLFRRENAHDIAQFLDQWYRWAANEEIDIQRRFNIQFRPISPGIDEVAGVRGGKPYPDIATHAAIREQVEKIRRAMERDPAFAAFVEERTNFGSYFGDSCSFDNSLFLHTPKEFHNCYNALCHRVLRATGDEYPDFLLCNEPDMKLGNVLKGDAEEHMLQVALMEFFYFNRMGVFCNPELCRQGWVSQIIEQNWDQAQKVADPANDSIAYFF